jgi:hypothetical protein
MRKILVFSASFFALLGIVLTVLPFGTIALLPIFLALVLAFLAFRISVLKQKMFPKVVLIIAAVSLLVVIGRDIFVKDTVALDKQFEKEKVESKKEDIKDLEGL